eukprot:jgi/Mesen1/9911/ME000070S09203
MMEAVKKGWISSVFVVSICFLKVIFARDVLIYSGDYNARDSANRTWLASSNHSAVAGVFSVSTPAAAHATFNAINSTNTNDPQLYFFAAIYDRPAAYHLALPAGRYWVRLYMSGFANFPARFPPAAARFSVVAGVSPDRNVTLLQGYTPIQSPQNLSQAIQEEFSVELEAGGSGGGLSLFLVPDVGSFAFVNAIEVTLWVDDLYGAVVTPGLALQTMARVNCGGSLETPRNVNTSDRATRTWSGDDQYEAAFVVSTVPAPGVVNGTTLKPYYLPLPVYSTARAVAELSKHYYFGLSYEFPAEAGWTYLVRFHWVEYLYQKPGDRIMDVFINGRQVLTDIDVFALGGFVSAVSRDVLFSLPRNETGLAIDIKANPASGGPNPCISGIEVLKLGSGATGLSNNLAIAPSTASAVALRLIASSLNPVVGEKWTTVDPCVPKPWPNVYCTGDSVIGLRLSNNSLGGNLTDAVGNLASLQEFLIEGNNLEGPVPRELLTSPNLRTVTLRPGNKGLCAPSPIEIAFDLPHCPGAGGGAGKAPVGAIVGGVLGGLIFLLLAAGILYAFVWRKHAHHHHHHKGGGAFGKKERELPFANLHHQDSKGLLASSPSPTLLGGPAGKTASRVQVAGADRVFSLRDLKKATDNFGSRNVIGQGAFGTTYYGVLSGGGPAVAVKRMNPAATPAEMDQVAREAQYAAQIGHRDLVPLLGYCYEKVKGNALELFLVYEYMDNRSLRYWLVESNQSLAWVERLKVVIAAARAVRYLHVAHKPPMAHRDIKTTNIFLDKMHNGRLSDYCISQGPKAMDPYAKPKLKDGSYNDLVDRTMRSRFNPESIKAVADLTLACLAEEGSQRPPMDYVLRTLLAALRVEEGDAYRGPPTPTGQSHLSSPGGRSPSTASKSGHSRTHSRTYSDGGRQ